MSEQLKTGTLRHNTAREFGGVTRKEITFTSTGELCAFTGASELVAFTGSCQLCSFTSSGELIAFTGSGQLVAFTGSGQLCSFTSSGELVAFSSTGELCAFTGSSELCVFTGSGEGTIPVAGTNDFLATREEYRVAIPHAEICPLPRVESIQRVAMFRRWLDYQP